MRKTFSDFIKKQLDKNKFSAILLGDISVGLFLDSNEALHERCLNVGILEQSMISLAAGMSRGGITTYVHTISAFLVERAYEQIKLDLDYNKNKVVLVSANGPYDYQKLGPTHHCSFDIPMISQLKSIKIYAPARKEDLIYSLNDAKKNDNSSYIRIPSSSVNNVALVSIEDDKAFNCVGSKRINILVGESLGLFNSLPELQNEDCIYIFKINEGLNSNLANYSEVIVWEPYANPILARQIAKKYPHTKIISKHYYSSMEEGIFDFPSYLTEDLT
jgi:transketolase